MGNILGIHCAFKIDDLGSDLFEVVDAGTGEKLCVVKGNATAVRIVRALMLASFVWEVAREPSLSVWERQRASAS